MSSSNNNNNRSMPSIKIILVGASSAGKSSCLHRFIDDVFNEEQTQTIGVEFGAKVVSINGTKTRCMVWDTAGQERYRSVSRAYYRGSVAAIIVYDITNRDTYNEVPQWLADVRQLCGEETTIMLIGNKTDLVLGNPERRQVPHTEASVFAQENGIMHMETSAQSGEFVPEAFLRVAKTTLQRLQQQQQQGGGNGGESKNTSKNLLVGGGRRNNNASSGSNNNNDEDGDQENVNSPVRLSERGNDQQQQQQQQGGEATSRCSRC